MSSITSIARRQFRFHFPAMATMGSRIKELRGEHSQAKFGEMFGVSREAVSQWENGKATPEQDKLLLMAARYGVTLDWLAGKNDGSIPKLIQKNNGERSEQIVAPHPRGVPASFRDDTDFRAGKQDLPILGRVRGGEKGEAFFIDNGEIAGYTMRPHLLFGVAEAYAVEFFDTSMEPVFKHGHLGWVHPHKTIKPGDDVVVQLTNGEALIKTLVRRTDKDVTLRQYNPPKDFKLARGDIKTMHLVVGSLRIAT